MLTLQDRFPSVNVLFLAIPPISVVDWNRAKGHTSPDNFKEADSIVSSQFEKINNWIAQQGKSAIPSPRFAYDITKNCQKEKERVLGIV